MQRPRWAGMLLFTVAIATTVGCDLLPKRAEVVANRPATTPVARSAPNAESEYLVISQLVDQPAGSDYLNRGLWQEINDPLPHEISTLLAANGLRVGVASSKPPQELERLGTSEASSVGLTQRTFTADRPRQIPVNGLQEASRIQVVKGFPADSETLSLTSADFGVEVTVAPVGSGYVKVRVMLQIQHGDKQPLLLPSSDGTGFRRTEQRPTATYPAMAFEVTLSRRDVLVVGPTEQPAGTLGQHYFFTANGDRLRQRVLVVQAGAAGGTIDDEPTARPVGTASNSVAAQAWRGPRRADGSGFLRTN